MFSITFPCQLLLFAFKTSPVCDYCVEPEQSCRWGGCSEGKGQVSRRKNVKFLLGAFFFHVRRFFISYVIIYLRCHSSPPDALCLPFRYFFFFLYSLSSASSPSISKAAYLLAELNLGVGVSSYFFGSGGGLDSRSLLGSFLFQILFHHQSWTWEELNHLERSAGGLHPHSSLCWQRFAWPKRSL